MLRQFFLPIWRSRRYGIPFLTVAVAFALKLLLAPFVIHESPFLGFFGAVLVSAYFGPRGSGLIATFLAALINYYFFLSPSSNFAIYQLGQGLQLALFVLENGMICIAIVALKSARRDAEQSRFRVLRQQETLRQTNLDLERRVAERTQQLLALNVSLSKQVADAEKVQAALQQSEERLNLALKASGDGIWDWDIATGAVYLSPQWLKMLGYDPGDLPGHVSAWEYLMHPDDKIWVTETLTAHLENSELPYQFSYRLRAKWGDWKWIANYGQVIERDPQQQPLRMVGIHRDVNEKKLVEKALLESEAKLRSFYDSTDIMIGIVELVEDDFLIVSANAAGANFWGLTTADLENRSSRELGVPAPLRQQWVEHCQQSARDRKTVQFEYSHTTARGVVWLVATLYVIASPSRRSRFLCIVEDVTEGRKIQQALEESEARYRAIVETQTELICRFQPDGTLLFVNEAYCRYFNKKPEELMGQVFLPLIPPEDREKVAQNLALLSAETPTVNHEHRVILPNGEMRWMTWNNQAFFERNGTLTVLQAIGNDITARKNAELQMAESLHEKEVLLKEVHHRVKNNLQVICSLLSLQARTLSDPAMTQHLKEAQNRVRSMAMVHEKLYQSNNFSKINLRAYVRDLVKYLFRVYVPKNSQISSKFEIDPGLYLEIDRAISCGLIIQELVSNALKYAFNPNEPGEIWVKAMAIAEEQIALSIQDNGKGLPADIVCTNPGTLGLRLVKDLTDQLDGWLDVNGSCGSCFTITFSQRKNVEFPT
ncbi:PAS domain S-box protein [Altericista sp. CCNU0014]|uniref:PAS domain S-box protein n=1 Tax=Altericista sp. CCNU0014 TaxID=3082949 RepID=UPI00384C88DE